VIKRWENLEFRKINFWVISIYEKKLSGEWRMNLEKKSECPSLIFSKIHWKYCIIHTITSSSPSSDLTSFKGLNVAEKQALTWGIFDFIQFWHIFCIFANFLKPRWTQKCFNVLFSTIFASISGQASPVSQKGQKYFCYSWSNMRYCYQSHFLPQLLTNTSIM
jgi:hypothetical protein